MPALRLIRRRIVSSAAGPEPLQMRSGAPLDYGHYSDRQLAPVADMVLRFFDMSYRGIIQKQLKLF